MLWLHITQSKEKLIIIKKKCKVKQMIIQEWNSYFQSLGLGINLNVLYHKPPSGKLVKCPTFS